MAKNEIINEFNLIETWLELIKKVEDYNNYLAYKVFIKNIEEYQKAMKPITQELLKKRHNKTWTLKNNGILEFGIDLLEKFKKEITNRNKDLIKKCEEKK